MSDRLLLRTVPGAVDYLVEELRGLAGVELVERRRDGVVVAVAGSLRALAGVRYFSSAAVVLADEVAAGLRESASRGVVSAVAGPVRFRVGEIGQRWGVRDELAAMGWRNEPGDWDVNLEDVAGTVAEVGGLYWTKRFGKLVRAPASTNPVVASVMVRLAKIEPGQRVLDPVCGAGTLLVTAGQMAPGARVVGADHDRRWVLAARENAPTAGLWRGDARRLPVPDGAVERVVANLPFGKRVGSHIGNQRLYPAVLGEIARVLAPKGRAVLLTEDKRLFTQTVQRTRGVRVIKEIVFETGGAHPSAYVVTTRRTR